MILDVRLIMTGDTCAKKSGGLDWHSVEIMLYQEINPDEYIDDLP